MDHAPTEIPNFGAAKAPQAGPNLGTPVVDGGKPLEGQAARPRERATALARRGMASRGALVANPEVRRWREAASGRARIAC